MKHTYRHIINRHSNRHTGWLLLSLLLLCLTACYSYDEYQTVDTHSDEQTTTSTQLYIYVHAPQTAVPTRAYTDEDDVDPINNEAMVYSLQIWVFTHDTKKLIGYFSSTGTSALNQPEGYEVYQLTIDEDYAQMEEASREKVDVYVLANVTEDNCHLTLDHSTTREELEAAVLAHGTQDAFGLTAPITVVPEGVGLPMSGVLRDQKVTGTAPVLRLGDSSQMAKVSLIRTVSKLRFAFANQTDNESLVINSIKLNAYMIPEEQYLFMNVPYDKMTCHIKTESGYNTTAPELLAATINDVPAIDQPIRYAWGNNKTLKPQEYETMMDEAVADGYLTQRMYYLRESDKKLQGEIKYQIGEGGEEQTATFQMVDEGGFSRNHIWTVYAYQAQAQLHVVVVTIASWNTTDEKKYDFYNW